MSGQQKEEGGGHLRRRQETQLRSRAKTPLVPWRRRGVATCPSDRSRTALHAAHAHARDASPACLLWRRGGGEGMTAVGKGIPGKARGRTHLDDRGWR